MILINSMSEHRLGEIVIERPRGGLRINPRKLTGYKKRLIQITQEATEEGLFRPYRIKPYRRTKWLSDHLGPLRRFLRSHVGQPWDLVYSELCQKLDTSTLSGQHVLSHVWHYVDRHVEIIADVPYAKAHDYWPRRRLGSLYGEELYVHPQTGMLCLLPKLRREPQPPRDDVIVIDRNHQYRQLDHIWYKITFQELPTWPPAWDVLIKASITPEIAYREYGRLIYATRKQQCDKRALKDIYTRITRLKRGK
jgi:hypothetical protein